MKIIIIMAIILLSLVAILGPRLTIEILCARRFEKKYNKYRQECIERQAERNDEG